MTTTNLGPLIISLYLLIIFLGLFVYIYNGFVSRKILTWLKEHKPSTWARMTDFTILGLSFGSGFRTGDKLIRYVFTSDDNNISEVDELKKNSRVALSVLLALMMLAIIIAVLFAFAYFSGAIVDT